jgi:hypothetical protein
MPDCTDEALHQTEVHIDQDVWWQQVECHVPVHLGRGSAVVAVHGEPLAEDCIGD